MDELAKRFAELAEKHGPAVVEAARAAVRVEGLSVVAGGAVLLGVAGALAAFGRHLVRKGAAAEYRVDGEVPTGFGYLAFVVAGVVATLGVWTFADPWTWAMFSEPDLWLARKALRL